jgi:acyl dehydratase
MMPLELSAIGSEGAPVERSWTSKDALLYAVAVGAGYPDPLQELAFTTENSREVDQQVLPTYGVLLGVAGGGAMRNIGRFNPAMLVHAEQAIEIHRPLTPDGTVLVQGRLVDIVDKRSGALVVTESRATDPTSGAEVFTTRSGVFIRGEGGFGGSGQASASAAGDPVPADREPDHRVSWTTLPNQALLYRLCGDRNPLHSDPAFAALAGFDRPILHGLCTYGFTGRALLHTLCDSDPARFRSMAGRFSKPVMPGATLTVEIWRDPDGGGASFRTCTDEGTVVIDRGRCTTR